MLQRRSTQTVTGLVTRDTDDDGDGTADLNDAFPLNSNEWMKVAMGLEIMQMLMTMEISCRSGKLVTDWTDIDGRWPVDLALEDRPS